MILEYFRDPPVGRLVRRRRPARAGHPGVRRPSISRISWEIRPLPRCAAASPGWTAKRSPHRPSLDRYRNVARMYQEQSGGDFSPALARQLGIPEQVVGELVRSQVLVREAERLGIEVTNTEVGTSIATSPTFQENGVFIGRDALSRHAARRPAEPAGLRGLRPVRPDDREAPVADHRVAARVGSWN